MISNMATIESLNPANKKVLGEVPNMVEAEIEEAVSRAWKCFQSWQMTDFQTRIRRILELRQVIEQQADDIARLVSDEVGKPLTEAYLAELTGPLDTCVWLAENAERHLSDQVIPLTNPLLSTKQSIVTYEPLGVIGVIAPWNFPFSIPMMSIIMAVMCGNTVVLKPSEKSPLTGIKISELFQSAGFPEGIVQVVTGDRTTGEHLSRANLARLIFTGSVEGGRQVMAQAAPQLTPVTLELGGKDAAIILPDAPANWTAQGIVWGAFTNAGQACASIERVYIVKGKNTDALINRIVYHARSLILGPGSDPTTDVGPLIDEIQLEKVDQHVRQAGELGAQILCGGKRRDDLGGYFFEPTVLTGVDHRMDIMTQETFGPILPIMVVDSEDQAVELANDSEYGLAASVWATRLSSAEAVARDLNVGTVVINDCLITHASPQVPWGGLKKSGFGRSHSHFGLLDLVNIKHISTDASSGSNRLWWYPYGPARIKTVRGGLEYLHSNSPLGKAHGLYSFITNIFRKAK